NLSRHARGYRRVPVGTPYVPVRRRCVRTAAVGQGKRGEPSRRGYREAAGEDPREEVMVGYSCDRGAYAIVRFAGLTTVGSVLRRCASSVATLANPLVR